MLPLNDILSGPGSGEIRNIPFDRPVDISLPRQQGSSSFADYLERARSEDLSSAPRNDSMNRSEDAERVSTPVRRDAAGSAPEGSGGPDAVRKEADASASAPATRGGKGPDAENAAGGEAGKDARRAEAARSSADGSDTAAKAGGKGRLPAEKTAGGAAGDAAGSVLRADAGGSARTARSGKVDREAAEAAEALRAGKRAGSGIGAVADGTGTLSKGAAGAEPAAEEAKAEAKAKSGSRTHPAAPAEAAGGESAPEQAAASLLRGKAAQPAGTADSRKDPDRDEKDSSVRETNGSASGRSREPGTGVRIEVVDLRKEALAARKEAASEGNASDSTQGVRGSERVSAPPVETGFRFSDGNAAGRTVPRDGQELFHRFMQQQGNEDVVRQAKVVLRNGGNGEIRLRLQPEHLGTVRISLRIEENHITGRIIVDNGEVKEAFQQNLPALQRAFGAEGFQSSGLEVSVGDDGKGRRERQDPPNRFVREAEEDLARSVPSADARDRGLVNLFV